MKKKRDSLLNRQNILLSGDWFDDLFITFLYKDLKIKENLNKKTFRLSDERISSRVINHWQELGLISDDRPKGKGWRKFSISEMLWISIIVKLRKFGLELSKIKKVKEYLDAFSLDNNQSKCPLLDFYILFGSKSKEPVKLLVFHTGEALIGRQTDIDISTQLGTIQDDYISIDINKLVSQSSSKFENITDYIDYSLTQTEKEIIQAVSIDQVKSITIKLNGKNEYVLDKEFIMNSKGEMLAMLNRLNYGEVTTVKQGDKLIYKVIEKKKIKKN